MIDMRHNVRAYRSFRLLKYHLTLFNGVLIRERYVKEK